MCFPTSQSTLLPRLTRKVYSEPSWCKRCSRRCPNRLFVRLTRMGLSCLLDATQIRVDLSSVSFEVLDLSGASGTLGSHETLIVSNRIRVETWKNSDGEKNNYMNPQIVVHRYILKRFSFYFYSIFCKTACSQTFLSYFLCVACR